MAGKRKPKPKSKMKSTKKPTARRGKTTKS